jgi:hypothetical protein
MITLKYQCEYYTTDDQGTLVHNFWFKLDTTYAVRKRDWYESQISLLTEEIEETLHECGFELNSRIRYFETLLVGIEDERVAMLFKLKYT